MSMVLRIAPPRSITIGILDVIGFRLSISLAFVPVMSGNFRSLNVTSENSVKALLTTCTQLPAGEIS